MQRYRFRLTLARASKRLARSDLRDYCAAPKLGVNISAALGRLKYSVAGGTTFLGYMAVVASCACRPPQQL